MLHPGRSILASLGSLYVSHYRVNRMIQIPGVNIQVYS